MRDGKRDMSFRVNETFCVPSGICLGRVLDEEHVGNGQYRESDEDGSKQILVQGRGFGQAHGQRPHEDGEQGEEGGYEHDSRKGLTRSRMNQVSRAVQATEVEDKEEQGRQQPCPSEE